MEGPERKTIRLKDYDYSKNGAYFVTICTQNMVHLFGKISRTTSCGCPNKGGKVIEKWLRKIQTKYNGVIIDKYIIMPNHIHCIVILTDDNKRVSIFEIMDWYKTMTTNEYIKGVKTGLYPPFNKRIWQRSYHDHIIRNETEYQRIWKYIDKNPEKWATAQPQPP